MNRLFPATIFFVFACSACFGLDSAIAQPSITQPQDFDSEKFEIRASLQSRSDDGKALLVVHVNVPKGWHIYGPKNSIQPTAISIDESESVKVLGDATIPEGAKHASAKGEEYWLTGVVTITQPVEIVNEAKSLSGKLNYMMCNEQSCKPPKAETFTVALNKNADTKTSDEAGEPDAMASPSKLLTVGSVAPELNIETWYPTTLSNSDPISKFKPGNVYVVEFWGTWCGPCVAGIPHLKEIQDTYKDQNVVVIGLTDEKAKTVEAFFKRNIDPKEEDGLTYGEVMSSYRVGSDLNRSCHLDYMTGAGQAAIPTAFIVGKTGLIEWSGHPNLMDEVLKQVVNDQWDSSKFDEQLKKKWKAKHERMAKQLVVKTAVKKLVEAHGKENLLSVTQGIEALAAQSDDSTLKKMYREAKTTFLLNILEEEGEQAFYVDHDFDRAKKIVDKLTAATDDPRALSQIETLKQSIANVIFYSTFGKDLEADKKMLRERVAKCEGDAKKINDLLWLLSGPGNRSFEIDYDPAIIRLGAELAKETLALDTTNGNVLYTLAHLHELQGDFKKAIEFQEQALNAIASPYGKRRHEAHIKKLKEKLSQE